MANGLFQFRNDTPSNQNLIATQNLTKLAQVFQTCAYKLLSLQTEPGVWPFDKFQNKRAVNSLNFGFFYQNLYLVK